MKEPSMSLGGYAWKNARGKLSKKKKKLLSLEINCGMSNAFVFTGLYDNIYIYIYIFYDLIIK